MRDHLRTFTSRPLSGEETARVFELLMAEEGAISDAQIAAYLYGTSLRAPTAEELAAAVRSLRSRMVRVELPAPDALLDTAGTGGSGLHTFNTSTVAAIICAALGQGVAKHGNRAASSSCGSADLLEALGVRIDLEPGALARCYQATRFCFMFAPLHHPATKRVAKVRKELGTRTIFNFLGPLCNPAGAGYQLLGVSEPGMLPIVAEALAKLGSRRALVVRGDDGLDEISLSAPTTVHEVEDGRVRTYRIAPEDFGLSRVSSDSWPVLAPAAAAVAVRELFAGKPGPESDLVCLNAGAALFAAGRAASIADGISQARAAVADGAANALLEHIIRVTSNGRQRR